MGGMYRVRSVSSGWFGGQGFSTHYFKQGDPADLTDINKALLCVDRVRAGWAAASALFPGVWTVQVQSQVDFINDVNGDLLDSWGPAQPALVSGGAGTGFGPTMAMVLLQLRTSTIANGKRLLGRSYLGPVNAGNDNDGTPNSGAVTTALAMGTALLDRGIAVDNPYLCVWRRPRDARLLPTPLPQRNGSSGIVTSITVPNKFASLRSRRD